MVLAATAVVAFSDDPAVPDDHGADQGIGADASFPFPGQPQGATHELFIRQTVFSVFHDMPLAESLR